MQKQNIFSLMMMSSFMAVCAQIDIDMVVLGLNCPFCSIGLEKHLREKNPGIQDIKIDINTGQVIFTIPKDKAFAFKAVKKAAYEAGFQAQDELTISSLGTVEKDAAGYWFKFEDGKNDIFLGKPSESKDEEKLKKLSANKTKAKLKAQVHFHEGDEHMPGDHFGIIKIISLEEAV